MLIEDLKELYRHRELLLMIAYRDIRVRYKQSIMGFLWAILMPSLIVLAGVGVRYVYALGTHSGFGTADLASVAVKSLPWAFFVSSIRFSCNSLTNNKELVTKIYFPREVFPVAAVMASLFDFLVACGALLIFLLAIRLGWSIHLVWIPALLVTMVLLATGIGMIVSAASLFLRDVRYIVEVVLTFAIFFTPVFYDARMVGDKGKWLLLNPVAPLLEGLSACIAHHQAPDLFWFSYSFAFAMVLFWGGYLFFKHLEPGFAESI